MCGAIASIASARHIAKGGFAAARRWLCGVGAALAVRRWLCGVGNSQAALDMLENITSPLFGNSFGKLRKCSASIFASARLYELHRG